MQINQYMGVLMLPISIFYLAVADPGLQDRGRGAASADFNMYGQ